MAGTLPFGDLTPDHQGQTIRQAKNRHLLRKDSEGLCEWMGMVISFPFGIEQSGKSKGGGGESGRIRPDAFGEGNDDRVSVVSAGACLGPDVHFVNSPSAVFDGLPPEAFFHIQDFGAPGFGNFPHHNRKVHGRKVDDSSPVSSQVIRYQGDAPIFKEIPYEAAVHFADAKEVVCLIRCAEEGTAAENLGFKVAELCAKFEHAVDDEFHGMDAVSACLRGTNGYILRIFVVAEEEVIHSDHVLYRVIKTSGNT
jgi:hypothetical protein